MGEDCKGELAKSWVWKLMHKVSRLFLILELPYSKSKSGVMLLKFRFLACPTRMVGPCQPYIGQSEIYDDGSHMQTYFKS